MCKRYILFWGFLALSWITTFTSCGNSAVDAEKNRALITAIQTGDTSGVRRLLEDGVKINVKNEAGQTALMWACIEGNDRIVHLLLEYGAKINIKDKSGQTALKWSCLQGNARIVELLLEKGADVNVKDKNGETPLIQTSETPCKIVL